LILRFGIERVIAHAYYSPDCYPVENLFQLLSRKINIKRQIFDPDDLLWVEIQSQLQQLGLDTSTFRNLAKSLPNRYREVIKKRINNSL